MSQIVNIENFKKFCGEKPTRAVSSFMNVFVEDDENNYSSNIAFAKEVVKDFLSDKGEFNDLDLKILEETISVLSDTEIQAKDKVTKLSELFRFILNDLPSLCQETGKIPDNKIVVKLIDKDEKESVLDKDIVTLCQCPKCKSENVLFDMEEISTEGSEFVYRMHYCNNCGVRFEERYDLVQVRILRGQNLS